MYRVRIYVGQKGVEDIALQISGRDKKSATPLLFYLTLQKELAAFQTRVDKALSASAFTTPFRESYENEEKSSKNAKCNPNTLR